MFPWDCGLSQLWGVVLLASQLGWSLSPSAAWSLCSPSWIKQQLHHLGIKFSERSITLNEWKEIKPIKTAASSFISLKTKLTINVFGLAWWGSLRGLLILHYDTVPVVVFHLFQCRVVSLLCLSYVCVCSSLQKSSSSWCSLDQGKLLCLLLMAHVFCMDLCEVRGLCLRREMAGKHAWRKWGALVNPSEKHTDGCPWVGKLVGKLMGKQNDMGNFLRS